MNKYTISKYLYFLTILLFWIIFIYNLFFGEITNINNGCGFDGGMFYAPVTKDFWHLLNSSGFDSYTVSKIFPQFIIASYGFLLNIEITDKVIINGYRLIHLTSIIIAWIYVIKFNRKMKFDHLHQSLLIILLFFNYPVLKLVGYVPVSPDATLYTIGIILAYFYLNKNINGLFIVSIFGMFMVPSFLIFFLPLFLFKQIKIPTKSLHINNLAVYGFVFIYSIIAIGVILLTYSFLFHLDIYKDEIIFNAMYSDYTEAFMFSLFPISLLVAVSYVYYAAIGFSYNYKIQNILTSINIKGIVLWLVLFLIYYSLSSLLVDSTLPKRSGLVYIIMNLFTRSLQYPAHFILAKVFYFGPVIVFIIFYWKKINIDILEKGYGLIAYTVVFLSLNLISESRFFLFLIPIYIFLLIEKVKEIKIGNVIILALVSLILSRFWFHIGYLEGDLYGDSMQRFQIGNGPFNSIKSYCISSAASLITILIIYFVFIKNRVKAK